MGVMEVTTSASLWRDFSAARDDGNADVSVEFVILIGSELLEGGIGHTDCEEVAGFSFYDVSHQKRENKLL